MLGVAAFVIALPAQAALLNFFVNLSGNNEVPPTGSPATGVASLTLDTLTNDLTGHIEFSGLVDITTAAHIHCCLTNPFQTGQNVGVATVVPAFPGFPLGVTHGVDDFVLDLNNPNSYNQAFLSMPVFGGSFAAAEAAFINGLETGRTYLNIHTRGPAQGGVGFPGGEIRGFVVPEPMTASLIVAGFAAAGFASRRRKRT
jgi:hypothetical protein